MKQLIVVSALAAVLSLTSGLAVAADQQRTQGQMRLQNQVPVTVQDQDRVQQQEVLYGSQLMTPQERNEQRMKMRAAKTPEERQMIRNKHHKKMQKRAKAKGVTLPAEPLRRGGVMKQRQGMGAGGGRGQ
ncbi:MAG: hypothetical protein ACPGF7_07360 [Pontibacterium sp.]